MRPVGDPQLRLLVALQEKARRATYNALGRYKPYEAVQVPRRRRHPARRHQGSPTARRRTNAIGQVIVRHGSGGDVQAGGSVLGLKSYDQGREKFQAETLDLVWLDEERHYDIYVEALTRTNKTLGPVYLTFTPLQGLSQTVMRFIVDKHVGTVVVFMRIYDAGHYTGEQADAIVAAYPAHEREARAYGQPVPASARRSRLKSRRLSCRWSRFQRNGTHRRP